MKLTPSQDSCAPITIAFTDFPGITVRVGRWVIDQFPSCGCDACDEMPDEEFEGRTELLDDVVAGRFRESMRLQPGGDGWSNRKFLHLKEFEGTFITRLDRLHRLVREIGGDLELDLPHE